MYSGFAAVLALAVFGASAQAVCVPNVGLSCGSSPVLENVPLALPSFVSPAAVQDTCNVVKTLIRPTVRQEVFNIPSVQRFTQTTSTPVVETVPFVGGAAATVPTTCITNPGLVGGYGLGAATGLVGGYGLGAATGLVGGYGLGGCGLGAATGLVGGYGLGGCGLGAGAGLVGGCGLAC